MRFLFLLTLAVNIGLLGYGQGFLGPAPSEQGRTPNLLRQQNQQAVKLGTPGSQAASDIDAPKGLTS